jgi:transcriptional regulator with XRE-family HTH domain
MIARNVTPSELSAKTGVPTRTIERWLSGTPPRRDRRSLDHVNAVAKYLRTSALFLLTCEKR